MGLRFRKTKSFGPLRLSLGKRGVGLSTGVRGARVSRSAAGRNSLTLSLLGTGLSWVTKLGRRR
jgi:hypothetical protein